MYNDPPAAFDLHSQMIHHAPILLHCVHQSYVHYDQRNRRTRLTNPLAHEWRTAYADLSNGGTQTTQTYPGLATGASYDVTREFDRLGRLNSIDYNSTTTPDVAFSYDIAGNRTQMTERTGTTDNRITHFGYDDQRRLTRVGFDTNGDGTVDETVSYSYDAGGNRTQMTLPGSKTITYSYDANGRLIGLTAWGNQHSDFHYDKAGRHVSTQRPNGLSSDYAYNPAGHLRRVRHRAGSSLRGQFNYTVDGRGNRTRAFEHMATATTVTNTLTKTDTAVTFPRGTWTDAGDFKQTAQFSGRMQIAYTGDEGLLTIGTGPDHGQVDLYINDNYWRRFDAYTAQPGEQVIHIPAVPTPPGATSGVIEIRNRSDRHHRSTGRVFRFKQLAVIDTTYNERTIDYTYDGLSRLLQADYDNGDRVYDFSFDLAGNRLQEALSGTGVTAKTTNYTYNAANQLTNDGTHTLTYDPNGNLTSDGTNTYTWDRANRMLIAPGSTTYKYDGLGNRIQQTVSSVVTDYLLDLQPGLTKVLGDSDGNHYIHAPRGLHAMQNNAGEWSYTAQDGLGSVRGLIDTTLGVDSVQSYNPYGVPDGNYGTGFGFTGEQTDPTGQLYLRARYYNPSLAIFPSLDPFEGTMARPMSLNGYSYVEGNPIMNTDPSGMAVDLGKIEKGETTYSCNCGWIDWEHANPIHPMNVIRTVKNAMSHPDCQTDSTCTGFVFQTTLKTWTGHQMRTSGTGLYGPFKSGNKLPWYFIPCNLTDTWQSVAWSIYSDLVREFESQEQGSWNPIARTSGYSVEDLPSYLMAFAIAQLLEEVGLGDRLYAQENHLEFGKLAMSEIVTLSECDVIWDIEANKEIYREDTVRELENTGFLPVDRSSALSRWCRGSLDASRIPSWLTALQASPVRTFRKSDGKSGCNDDPLKLPYPNDPDNPADVVDPETLLLHKCGGC